MANSRIRSHRTNASKNAGINSNRSASNNASKNASKSKVPRVPVDQTRFREFQETVAKWNAANPEFKMNMAPFKRSAFRRDLRVSLVSGYDMVQHADILTPLFQGTDNDVLFVMHYGFITTCKLEDLARALTLRRMISEAVRAVEPVLDKKGMRIVYEQLPYPEFDTRKVDAGSMGADTKRYLSFDESEACKDEIVRVMRYYVTDVFSEPEFVVVRGNYRTPVTSKVLDRTVTATAFLDACCICCETSYTMKCPFECARHSICGECCEKMTKNRSPCPMCRAGALSPETLKRWMV